MGERFAHRKGDGGFLAAAGGTRGRRWRQRWRRRVDGGSRGRRRRRCCSLLAHKNTPNVSGLLGLQISHIKLLSSSRHRCSSSSLAQTSTAVFLLGHCQRVNVQHKGVLQCTLSTNLLQKYHHLSEQSVCLGSSVA